MEKEDKRITKTKKAIKESFITLVEQKGYENVSVSNICEGAMINRNTFYLHYNSKDDLLRKITLELASRIITQVQKYLSKDPISQTNHDKMIVLMAMRKLLRIIDEEMELIRIIALDNTVSVFADNIKYIIKKDLALSLGVSNYKSDPYFVFAFDGLYAVIIQYIVYYPQSENDTVRIVTDLVYEIMTHIWGE